MSPENNHFLRCLEALKDSFLFKDLEVAVLHKMLTSMTRSQWDTGTFKTGKDVKSILHFIISGKLKEYQINPNSGREHTIFILSQGDVFDMLRLIAKNE